MRSAIFYAWCYSRYVISYEANGNVFFKWMDRLLEWFAKSVQPFTLYFLLFNWNGHLKLPTLFRKHVNIRFHVNLKRESFGLILWLFRPKKTIINNIFMYLFEREKSINAEITFHVTFSEFDLKDTIKFESNVSNVFV